MRCSVITFGITILSAAPLLAQAQAETEWTVIEETTSPEPAPQPKPQVVPNQAKLVVTVVTPPEPVAGVQVFVDGAAVGPAPWEGVVAPGAHKVRAEGTGWASRSYKVAVAPNQSQTVRATLLRNGEFDLGKWYAGLLYSFGVGSSYSGGERYRLNAPGLGPGLGVGMRLPLQKLWLEAGLVVGPWTDRWIDYDPDSWAALSADEQVGVKKRSGQGMPLSVTIRYVSPIAKPFLYWTATFEPGVLVYGPYKYDEADPQYGYVKTLQEGEARAIFTMSLRAGLAVFPADWLEIRVDPLGMGLHCTKPFGVVYTPSFAIMLRL
ncbi:MAG: PEGA domain-containing protein [Proteobacteria bacterium]|jgi:hypothetical protein|nr:PEGA domain-containing protein [Pseudomonadota bacterium]